MSRWIFVALVLAFSSSVVAQTSEQEVLAAERARVDARRKGDSVAHARFVSDDFAQVSANGQLRDKKYAVSLAATPALEILDSRVQVFGDVAVVTGIQRGTAPNAQDIRFTHVWRKQNGQWVNVFVQNTSIASTPPVNNPVTASQIAPTKWLRGDTQDERDVLRVQRGLNEAFAKQDFAAYSQLTADTFVRINVDGRMISRGDFLKIVAGTPDLERVAGTADSQRVESNNSGFRFRVYGPIAILSYIDKALNGPPGGIRMTRVFVKQDGKWKGLVTQSSTVVP